MTHYQHDIPSYHVICVCREIARHEYGLTQQRLHGFVPEAAVTHVQHIIHIPIITINAAVFIWEGGGCIGAALFEFVQVDLAENLHEWVLTTPHHATPRISHA